MTHIFNLQQIKETLNSIDVISEIEKGFIEYSKGNAIVPPVGELVFQEPPGDVHIKYGYLKNDTVYVVKIASGFPGNTKLNLPPSNGMMILFCKKTGAILAILLDEGYLTDIRTAAAGAIAAKYLAPKKVTRIGIVGTGTQAKLQLLYLKKVVHCHEVIVWGRNNDNLKRFKENIEDNHTIQLTNDIHELTSTCNLIVTATSSTKPLLYAKQIKQGTHITAVGSDTPHKQELDPYIFQKADIIVADSISQCIERGDISWALKNNMTTREKLTELGSVISGISPQRTSDNQITIADLTGIAVQDLQIAKAICFRHIERVQI